MKHKTPDKQGKPAPHKNPQSMRRQTNQKPNILSTKSIAIALGASEVVSLRSKGHGPFGAMALLGELNMRLISRGGRPADTAPTIRRVVTLRSQVWKELQEQAAQLSKHGKAISPGQLAALLIERSMHSL